MLQFSRWKTIAIAALVALAALLSVANILPKAQQEALAPYGIRAMTLGLDLQGGSNVLLEIDRKDMITQLQQQLSGDTRAALREAKIGYSGIQRIGTGIAVKITKPEDLEKAKTTLQTLLQPLSGGLLTSGLPINLYALSNVGDTFTFTVQEPGLDAKIAAAINQSLTIVEKRVNALGTTEPVIQQQGKDRIVVQLPGLDDPDKVKNVIGQTAKLTFQLLCNDQPTAGATNQNPPQDCRAYPLKEDPAQVLWVQTSSRATVDGADLNDAQPSFDQSNQPVVSFRFNQKGAVRFGKLTAENVNKPFAII